MNKSKRKKVGTRISWGFMLMIGILALVGGLGVWLSQTIQDNLEEIFAVRLPSINIILEIDRDLYQLLVAERSMIFSDVGSENFDQLLEEYQTNLQQSKDRWEEYKTLASSPQELEIIPQYEKARSEWEALSKQVVDGRLSDTREGRALAIDLTLGSAKEQFEKMRGYLDQLTEINLALAEEENVEAKAAYQANVFLVSVLLAVGVIVGVILSIFITRSITNPLSKLLRATEAAAQGDLTAQVEIRSQDELGRLGQSFNVMLGSLRDLTTGIVNTASTLAASSQELNSSVQEVSKATQEIAQTITQIAQGSGEQSEEIEKIGERAREVAQQAKTIQSSTKHNLELLQKMKSALELNLNTLSDIRETINLTAQESKTSRDEAQRGQEFLLVLEENINSIAQATQDVGQSISALDERSQEIEKMVELITGIAEQTNLLALNAAIEAARAGEAGRGFAVVAEEVRKLAEESGKAADQISELVAEIKEDTQRAVERMDRAGQQVKEGVNQEQAVNQNFARIIASVERTINKIEALSSNFTNAETSLRETAQNSEEVASLSEDSTSLIEKVTDHIVGINESISSVASVSEENAASSQEVSASAEEQSAALEEITSATESLARLAQELQNMVAKFRL
ncbi:MAG: methyl-accepting chemotaxis protein [Candidatus Atribacteria bacterium]|nr:methyl-accepting chemotaxis protein [Candidatus Atribacteria bacterium]